MRKGIEYDLIIIDESIPKLSSEDTLNKIKDTKCYKKPVILITKNKEFGSRENVSRKGVQRYNNRTNKKRRNNKYSKRIY